MQIDKKLNIVIPVERNDGTTIYVHTTPLDYEVFEQYFIVLGKAFSSIFAEGLSVIGGPRVAALMLKKVAIDMGVWDGDGGVQQGLMAEIQRLSNVVAPGPGGWQTLPLYNAQKEGLLTAEEMREVEGQAVFFILTSALNKPKQIPVIMQGVSRLWGAQTTLSNSTEFAASLKTSTEAANTGASETEKPLSAPY